MTDFKYVNMINNSLLIILSFLFRTLNKTKIYKIENKLISLLYEKVRYNKTISIYKKR